MRCIECYKNVSVFENYGGQKTPLCQTCWEKKKNEPVETKKSDEVEFEVQTEHEVTRLVTVAAHLTVSEAEWLAEKLKNHGVEARVETHGSIGKHDTYYRVDSEIDEAGEVEKFVALCKQEMKGRNESEYMKQLKCPKCGSRDYLETARLGFIERIRFFGVKVYMCEKCGKKFA